MNLFTLRRKVVSLYKTATIGPLNPWLQPLHSGLITLELAIQKYLDEVWPHETTTAMLNDKLTVLVKTFMRPHIVQRLIASVRRFYPNIPIIVVDDSPSPQAIPGVDTLFLPYNSGVSMGRMEGLRRVQTPFVLLLDDDFIFYRHTRLERALLLLEQFPTIDIMGGTVVNLPLFNTVDYRKAPLYQTTKQPTYPIGTRIGNMPILDKVANFYIARTDKLGLVGWDTNIRMLDHADFFTQAKGILTTVYNKDLRCLHARTPFDKVYMSHRNDYLLDVAYLQRKYKFYE